MLRLAGPQRQDAGVTRSENGAWGEPASDV